MGPAGLSLRTRRLGLRTVAVATVALTAALLGGCDDDPEADASSLYCGILDPDAADAIVGDVDVSDFGGGDLDAKRRQGNAVTCTISTGTSSDDLITITTMDTTDQADWDAMKAQLDGEVADSAACEARTESPVGYVCQGVDGTDETTLAVLFDDRWVRVTARTRDGGTPPDPDAVLAVAENVDKNLAAYDAEH